MEDIDSELVDRYFLERSHSARVTLSKAYELCPEEVRYDLTNINFCLEENLKFKFLLVLMYFTLNDMKKKILKIHGFFELP